VNPNRSDSELGNIGAAATCLDAWKIIIKWNLKPAVGAFIVNFGSVEWSTINWIKRYSSDASLLDRAIASKFSDRVDILLRVIAASDLADDQKRRAVEIWEKIKELSLIRNTIAHSPVIMRATNGIVGPCVINIKKYRKGREPSQKDALGIVDILRSGKTVAKLLKHISNHFEETNEKPFTVSYTCGGLPNNGTGADSRSALRFGVVSFLIVLLFRWNAALRLSPSFVVNALTYGVEIST